MAENESLDIGNRSSRRWRALRDLIRNGEADDVVVAAVLQNLYQTFKHVVRQVPLDALLDALLTGGDVRAVIRDCQDHEYAQLIARQLQPGLSAFEVIDQTLWATTDRFLDQIEIEVVGTENWPDIRTFEEAKTVWRAKIFDDLRALAGKLAANPEQPPRLPPRTADQKNRDLAQLNSMSLLGGTGGHYERG
jgi:hypothetical protein